ncbi:flagellin [Dyella sedimenti]|uniref:flagellin N-terminal helical domain-containing protein n=1 Tax=Dyella sedimenti TaxID=2919947 RepID=UPI001FA9B2E1|nr:flagellin [Dyella sedimenti]
MSLVINTNISSLTAQNNLTKSQNALSQATQRLSSGLKINSAADNAAGFAIAQRYTTQIGGLTQASANASDAINLAQTAGSALDQVTANLQAIRDLAVQSANGTYTDDDRNSMDQEVQQRLAEITRIANQTTFNGSKVLDGSLGTKSFQIGADVGQTISVSLGTSVKASDIGQIATSKTGDISGLFKNSGTKSLTLAAGDLSVNGTDLAGTYASAQDLANAINTAVGDNNFASVDATSGELDFSNSSATAVTFAGAQAATVVGANLTVAAQTTGTVPGTASSTGVPAAVGGAGLTLAAGDLTVNGTNVAAGTYTTAQQLADAINTAAGGNIATVDATSGELDFSNSTGTAITFGGTEATALSLTNVPAASAGAATPGTGATTGVAAEFGTNGAAGTAQSVTLAAGDLNIDGTNITGTFTSVQDLADAINAASYKNSDGSSLSVSAAVNADGTGLNLYSSSALTIYGTAADAASTATNALKFSGAADTQADATAIATSGSLAGSDVKTVDDANALISRIDVALQAVSDFSAQLGAVQNRFQSTISTVAAQTTNLQASQSTIQDADFAAETANLSKAQVLQQAGISVLAQANSNPQQVLKLLQ